MKHWMTAAGCLGFALVGSLVELPQAQAAGFQNGVQSGTAISLGGVGTANPDEPNASFYNPSNMPSQGEGLTLYLGGTLIVPSTSYQSLDGSRSENTESQLFPPPNLHMAYNLGNLAFGLGVTLPYGLGIRWPDAWEGREYILSQDLQTINITPSVAYRIESLDLSFSLGAQIVRGTVELERDVILRPADPNNADSQATAVNTKIAAVGMGYGATASVTYRPVKELTLALNYRSRVTVNASGDAHFEGDEGTPFERTFVDQPFDTSLTLPDSFTLGIGYQLGKLFLGLDATFTTWSVYDVIRVPFEADCPQGSATCQPGETTPPDTEIVANWNDAMLVRFGSQWEAIDNLKLRLGVAYDMTPIPEQTLSPSLPGNNRVNIGAGAGYNLGDLRIDLGYMFVKALEREVVDTDNLPGVYNTTAHLVSLGLGYNF